ncbi:ABC transporter ATP-binding protein [Oricola nitratireducens]|uniref:ABC transporter ATP-binding protein n=1 Tax=Oricola nitratireducens TaxID=2775868 RepID=UPI0018694CE3|nr:sn-glycerol-3-phosphate ABC transporter ATP-binding protein UgpC [Oricola nitratireducens]
MANVEVKQLRKSFGSVDVIHGVDLSIDSGEFAVFVGPSGCGKSTLLRLIAGLEDATSGTIHIGDADVTRIEPADRGVAMVFQSYALYPHMSVEENMGFGLRMTGTDRAVITERVNKAAQILHLDQLLERKPKQLSGGQRQRVAIGRAIVREPKVFLFDEPLSNLDAELRVQMRLEIAKLHNDLGATMIYVTHDQVEAMTLADKIVVLRSGRIEQVGAPLELYGDPDNIFVAGFIGSPKMNFLPAIVESTSGDAATVRLRELGSAPFSVPVQAPAGAEVIVGIRPEHFDSNGTAHIEARIDVIEHLGGVSYGYAAASGDEPLTIALAENTAAKAGAVFTARFDPARAFLFDPETGLRIR